MSFGPVAREIGTCLQDEADATAPDDAEARTLLVIAKTLKEERLSNCCRE